MTGLAGCGGGCRGGCGDGAHAIVPVRPVLNRLSPTPAMAAAAMQRAGTYGDWVTDVPVQGPTDPGNRAAGCWWKENVLDKVTDRQGAMVPRWTQASVLCTGPRFMQAGVGETVRRAGRVVGSLGQSPSAAPAAAAPAAAPATKPATAPAPAAGDAQTQWALSTLARLNDLIVKAGNKPCANWPTAPITDPAAMTAAVACFQGWFNLNMGGTLHPDGTLDQATLCALVQTTQAHPTDFPTPYPGLLSPCGLSTIAKIGIGAGIAIVGGVVLAKVIGHGKKSQAPSAPAPPAPATGGG